MKAESLIIDVRDQLPWHKRYLSNSTTLLLWGCWLLLWQPIMNQMGLLETQNARLVDKVLHAFLMIVEQGFIAILICAVMLWLWSHFIPSKTAKYSTTTSVKEYAHAFALSEDEIVQARRQKVVTVFHNDAGKIVHIQSQATDLHEELPLAASSDIAKKSDQALDIVC